jgi:type IV secretion system protein VirB8
MTTPPTEPFGDGRFDFATPAADLPRVDWETSLVANESRSRRTAWQVAGAASLVALVEAGALVGLTPLHSVVPYVVTVDRATGDAMVTPSASRLSATNELNDKHWVAEYVSARQRYLFRLLQHDYDTVQRFSDPAVWSSYAAIYEGDKALDTQYGDQTEILPRILSITVNEPGIATVRLEIATHAATGEVRTQRYIATVRYQYRLSARSRESELIENPFGFRVTGYHLDEELGSAP